MSVTSATAPIARRVYVMASSLLGCPVTVAVELVRRPRGSLAGPEEAVKIGERARLVQALRRPVYSRSLRPPPLREFLFRPRHWRLPRCLEIDRYLVCRLLLEKKKIES